MTDNAGELRRWAETHRDDTSTILAAVARYTLAHLPKPPTLADEIREHIAHGEDLAVWNRAAVEKVADRVEQIEQERDEARAEVITWRRRADHLYSEVGRLTAERDRIATGRHITYAEMDGEPLPDPVDVKPGEPWLIRVGDREAVANRDGTSDEWPWSVAFFDGEADDMADKAITLVSRLVPAPRVITNPDELERLAATSIIRDGLGWPGGVTDQGELMRLNSVVLDPVELLRLGPVTVLWEAGA